MSKKSTSPGRPKDSAKREAILDAAANLFTEHGYDGTSMDLVAQEASVSKQTVYSHFQNKEALFKSAVEMFSDRIIPPDESAPPSDAPVRSVLMGLGMGLGGLIMSDEAMAVHRMVTGPGPDARRLAELFYEAGPKAGCDRMEIIFAKLQNQGKLNLTDAHLAVHQFVSLIKGENYFKRTLGLLDEPTPAELKKHVEECVDAFLRIYGN